MRTVTEMRAAIDDLLKKLGDMKSKCIQEKRDPDSEERTRADSYLDNVKELEGLIALEERTQNTLDRLHETKKAVDKPDPGSESRSRRTEQEQKDRFSSFGEQMASVMQAGLPNGRVDPRLSNTRAASGLGEAVPSDGGFLVQQDFSSELLQDVFETGVLASKCRRIQISGPSNGIKINGVDETSRAASRSGGIIAYWTDEAGEKTDKKPKFRKIELNLHKLTGLCYATDELLDDAAALEGIVREGFNSEFGFQIDNAIFNGDGVARPLGVLQSDSLVSVPKETGQKADTLMAENIIKMYSRRFAAQTGQYAWYYNQNIEPQLYTMSLAVGTGGIPIYMPPGGLSDAPYARIMGLPAIAIEQAQPLGDLGDIVLGNFPKGYLLAEKGGVKSDMSIHVRFIYDESVFRFVLRIDGQPVRASSLTPFKGAEKQGHFISLAARA